MNPAPTSKVSCGRTKSLLEASAYSSRPKEFDDLIRILDSELRLITPTDPEGKERGMTIHSLRSPGGRKYYQLTHDYLVPLVAGLADPQAEGVVGAGRNCSWRIGPRFGTPDRRTGNCRRSFSGRPFAF